MGYGWRRGVCSALLLLLLTAPLFASEGGDTYERVLRRTAESFGLDQAPTWTGAEEDELYNVVISGAVANDVRLGFKCTAYRDIETKKRHLRMAAMFATLGGGAAPAERTSTRSLKGARIEELDRPAFVAPSPLGSVTIPRSREMRVPVSKLVTFSVATGGGRDPTPYMVTLIQQLREAGLLGPAKEPEGVLLQAKRDGFLTELRTVEVGEGTPSSLTITGWVLDEAGEALGGVQVELPSLKEATVTDAEGAFRLDATMQGSKPFEARAVLTLKASGPGSSGGPGDGAPVAGEAPPARQGLPWLAALGGFFLVVAALGTRINLLRRLLAACLVAPLMTATLMAIGQMAADEQGGGSEDFLSIVLSPWTAWQRGEIWLPAAAWLAGGLTVGLIMAGPIRGMIAGLLMPLAPWVLIHRPWIAAVPEDGAGFERLFADLASGSAEDLLTILGLSVFGGGLGALFLPRRSAGR